MLLVDTNNIFYASILVGLAKKEIDLTPDMIRHMILNSLRAINMKFKDQYGEMILACDHPNSWRRDIFPYYKQSRREGRANSNIDWKLLFSIMQEVRDELKQYFPYRVLQIDGCEADDIIGVLSRYEKGKMLIVSVDKDFVQLHNESVKQYNPVGKKFVEYPDGGQIYLKQHIIRGDSGDGIPNILSNDDCFVIKKRQGRITEKQLNAWMFGSPEQLFPPDTFRRYKRNENLIDLSNTPERFVKQILAQFESEKGKDRSKIFGYLISKRMRNLTEQIQDF